MCIACSAAVLTPGAAGPQHSSKEHNVDSMQFNLGDAVKILESGEQGRVVGRAEYEYAEPGYLVRYKAADGRAVEAWWTQGALVDA